LDALLDPFRDFYYNGSPFNLVIQNTHNNYTTGVICEPHNRIVEDLMIFLGIPRYDTVSHMNEVISNINMNITIHNLPHNTTQLYNTINHLVNNINIMHTNAHQSLQASFDYSYGLELAFFFSRNDEYWRDASVQALRILENIASIINPQYVSL